MELAVGQIYQGQVKSITPYGAFVEVLGDTEGESATGMVHISEISNTFVRDIHDYISENDSVQVKVIAITPQGKISMSMKQVSSESSEQKQNRPREPRKPRVYEPKKSVPQSEMSFEDMMLHFKQCSEENICDLRRGSERKGGSRSRK